MNGALERIFIYIFLSSFALISLRTDERKKAQNEAAIDGDSHRDSFE
jgi:hypothetical protein